MKTHLTPEDINKLLILLVSRLDKYGYQGEIHILGGAAMNLAYLEDRRSTADIDAVFSEREFVLDIANQIAHDEDLEPGWFNDAVRVFIPEDVEGLWRELYSFGSVKVKIANPEFLLALKLSADRGLRDRTDIQALLPICGVTSVEQASEILKKYLRHHVLQDKTIAALMEMLKQER